MKLEEFILKLRELNYGIVAMNEYAMNGVLHIYVVVKERDHSLSHCINQEGSDYEKVFDNIVAGLINKEES